MYERYEDVPLDTLEAFVVLLEKKTTNERNSCDPNGAIHQDRLQDFNFARGRVSLVREIRLIVNNRRAKEQQ